VDLSCLIMRTRSKSIPDEVAIAGDYIWNSYLHNVHTRINENVSYGPVSIVTRSETEVIIDDPSPGRGIKPVNHTKELYTGYIGGASSRYYSTGASEFDERKTGQGVVWIDWIPPVDGKFRLTGPIGYTPNIVFDKTIEQLQADAVHDFYSTNETDNLLNIIEADQLVSSMRSLKQTLQNPAINHAIRESVYDRQALLRRIKMLRLGGSLKKQLRRYKGVSSLYLLYSFGIAPLVSDMTKVQAAVKDIRVKMAAFRKSSGKLVSLHRHCTGRISYRRLADSVNVGSTVTAAKVLWEIYCPASRRTVTVRGIRSSSYNSEVFSNLDYLLSRFGVTGPAALVWELIPWSFVVDWFVDLRAITDNLDNLLTGNTKQIVDIAVSEKSNIVQQARLSASALDPAGLDNLAVEQDGTVLAQLINSKYTRNPAPPNQMIRGAGRFGKKQASIMAALLHQTLANRYSLVSK